MPAATVFAVLAGPAAHAAIDGTGWVQEAADRAPLAEVGQVFRMDMYHPGHPDGNYRTANKVQVLDPPRADWSAVPPDIREYLQFPPFEPEHLINSLRHLAELAAPALRASAPRA